MAEFPYMIWFPRDFHADTSHLTPMAELAYRRILEFLWLRGGTLPLDHGTLSRLSRASGRSWGPIWQQLEPLLEVDHAAKTISQRRITADLLEADQRASRQSAGGKAGAAAKHNKYNGGSLAKPQKKDGQASSIPSTYNHLPPNPPEGGLADAGVSKAAKRHRYHSALDTEVEVIAKGIDYLETNHQFVIDVTTDEWQAWSDHNLKTKGKRPPGSKGYWFFPTRWPPGADPDGSGDQSGGAEHAPVKTAAGGPSQAQQTAIAKS